jgi:glucans biosynthesis protein C
MSEPSPARAERVYFMDLGRAAILLVGVFFHAALLYQDRDHTLGMNWFPGILAGFLDFVRGFRMESLFLVSGFFSAVLVSNRGSKGFVRNRMVRMGVPLFFCGILFNPIPFLFLTPPSIEWLNPHFFLSGHWMDHLWNIANLLVYESSVFLILFFWPSIHGFLARIRLNAPLGILAYLSMWLLFAAIWTRLPTFEGSRMLFNTGALPLYAPAYLLGYLLHQNKPLRDSLFNWKISIPFVLLAWSVLHFASQRFPESMAIDQKWGMRSRVFLHLTETLVFFSVIRLLETPNIWVKRISIASYTIYILHLPLQVLLLTFIPTLREGYFSFFLLGLVPILVIWVFHVQVVERWKWCGFLFNGKVYDQKTRSF